MASLGPSGETVEATLAEVAAVLRPNEKAKEGAAAVTADVDSVTPARDYDMGHGGEPIAHGLLLLRELEDDLAFEERTENLLVRLAPKPFNDLVGGRVGVPILFSTSLGPNVVDAFFAYPELGRDPRVEGVRPAFVDAKRVRIVEPGSAVPTLGKPDGARARLLNLSLKA